MEISHYVRLGVKASYLYISGLYSAWNKTRPNLTDCLVDIVYDFGYNSGRHHDNILLNGNFLSEIVVLFFSINDLKENVFCFSYSRI